MKTDTLGIPRFSNRDLIDMIYSGNADKVHVVLCDQNDDVDKFNEVCEEQGINKLQKYIPLDVDEQTFDGVCQSEWFMPDEYKELWHKGFAILAKRQEELQSDPHSVYTEFLPTLLNEELCRAFTERGMLPLLRYMIYLVDFMRENDIVWGVGRGSSVASYVLYLIGVHRIDSIQYDLDWREFLR